MNPLALWDSVWIALLTSAILFGSYRAVEWRWPERYLGMSQTFGLSSQETWLRFVLYRAVPTYIFSATCLVTVERLGGYLWVSGVVLWLASIAATHGKVVVEGIVRRWGEANYAGYHVAMILLLTTVLFIAGASRQAWGLLVSPPTELLSALWSGLLVAGLGGFVIFAVRPRPDGAPVYGPSYLLERATRDVGVGEFDWLFAECARTGSDPVLLKALLVVEAVQRPKWLRQIERLGVTIGMARTSGVMQMSAARPLSDHESITAAAETYSENWAIAKAGERPYKHWSVDLGSAWAAVTTHNGDARFASSVASVADFLVSGNGNFFYFDDEHRTVVLELRRYSGRFALRGATSADTLLVMGIGALADDKPAVLAPSGKRGSGGWWVWEQEIDTRAHRVVLCELPSGLSLEVKLRNAEISSVAPVRSPWSTPTSNQHSTISLETDSGVQLIPRAQVRHVFAPSTVVGANMAKDLAPNSESPTAGPSAHVENDADVSSSGDVSVDNSTRSPDPGPDERRAPHVVPAQQGAAANADVSVLTGGVVVTEGRTESVRECESATDGEPVLEVNSESTILVAHAVSTPEPEVEARPEAAAGLERKD